MTRVFLARYASPTLPDLPDDLDAVCDIKGVIWLRVSNSSPRAGNFTPSDRLKTERLPSIASWHSLLVTRGPVSECHLLEAAPMPTVEDAA